MKKEILKLSCKQSEEVLESINYHLDFDNVDLTNVDLRCTTCCDPDEKYLVLFIDWSGIRNMNDWDVLIKDTLK